MPASKLTVEHGVLLALEGSYAEGIATTAPDPSTDGILPEEEFDATPEVVDTGERNVATGLGGPLKRSGASGLSVGWSVPVLARGAGAAYAAAADLQDLNVLLQVCGYDVAVDSAAGSEKLTYTPNRDPAAAASAAAELYGREERWDVEGIFGSLQFEIDGPNFVRFNPQMQGLLAARADEALPSITYQGSPEPPKAENMAVTIGNFTDGVVRSISFDAQRTLGSRANVSGDGHAGFSPGTWNPRLTIQIEAVPLTTGGPPWTAASTINPYKLWEEAESVAIDFTAGATQYNRVKFNAAQAQLASEPSLDEDEPTALWTLEFMLAQSAPKANDDHSWVFD